MLYRGLTALGGMAASLWGPNGGNAIHRRVLDFVGEKRFQFELAILIAIDRDKLAYAPNTIAIQAEVDDVVNDIGHINLPYQCTQQRGLAGVGRTGNKDILSFLNNGHELLPNSFRHASHPNHLIER